MPESLQTFIWIFGVAIIGVLLAMVGFFFVRLISGLDNFKSEMTAAIRELGDAMHTIHVDLGGKFSDLNARVGVIEEAGCIIHRRRKDDQYITPRKEH